MNIDKFLFKIIKILLFTLIIPLILGSCVFVISIILMYAIISRGYKLVFSFMFITFNIFFLVIFEIIALVISVNIAVIFILQYNLEFIFWLLEIFPKHFIESYYLVSFILLIGVIFTLVLKNVITFIISVFSYLTDYLIELWLDILYFSTNNIKLSIGIIFVFTLIVYFI